MDRKNPNSKQLNKQNKLSEKIIKKENKMDYKKALKKGYRYNRYVEVY